MSLVDALFGARAGGAPAPGAGAADEVELKAVVPDPAALRARLEAAGARLLFEGALADRRYDTADGRLERRDEVLRLRTAEPRPGAPGAARASLDWKGPTREERGYKVREERSTAVGDPAVVALVLARLGLTVRREVDREVAEYAFGEGALAAALRVERYPRMDVLLEVEGAPAAIERAIAATGLPRAAFTAGRLVDYRLAFERRTGLRAATARRELDG
jgi:adenylate cyclase class IV